MRRLALLVLVAACFERGGGGRAAPSDGAARDGAVRDAAPGVRYHVPREPEGVRDPGATIRVALEAEPATLDPRVGGDAVTQRVMADVAEGLVCAGARLGDAPVPCLAESWTVAEEGRRWTFRLRDARWHDGAVVRAADVAASIEGTREGWLAGELEDLVRAAAAGERDVVLTFRGARPDRLARLASVPVVRVPDDGALPLGTGPMRVAAWRKGDAIELARADDRAAAARVVYRIAERAEALRLLAAGELDVVVQVPVDEATRFVAEHDGVQAFTYRLPAFLAAIYNARRPALATPAQRRALTALLDREGIAARLLHARAITGPFADGDPGHDPTVPLVPFDRALATDLLAGKKPRVEVLVPQGSTTMAKVADVWASDARGIVDLVVVTVPFADVLARLAAGDFDVALMSMRAGPDEDLAPRLSSTAPREDAWTGLADPELDRLLEAAQEEADAARRAQARRAVHRRLAALDAMGFIAPDVRLGLARVDVGGLAASPEGAPPRAARLWRARPR